VLHVKAPFPVHGRIGAGALENVQEHHIKKEKTRLSKIIPTKLKNSIAVEEIQVTGIPIHRVIIEKARELGVDVIVMASQNRTGLMRFFKKDIIEQVIQNAHCSIFVVRSPQNQNQTSNESDD
jgi:nucleotide-binding universal stress UspA family protein